MSLPCFQRDFLFDCVLTLYLKSSRLAELRDAFRTPVFCVNLDAMLGTPDLLEHSCPSLAIAFLGSSRKP